MPIVEVKILNSKHQISCDEGEQDKLLDLAKKLNDRINIFAGNNNQATEVKLLVLNSLIMESRISELEDLLERKQVSQNQISEETVVKTLNTITDYVENLAKKLESM